MAETNAQAEIRGLNIDKLAKGFADEALILKQYVTVSNTSSREIRWYRKTAGFLDTTDTTGITASQIPQMPSKARPQVIEQSWTRNTSYVKKYFVESPVISDEDIKDTDIDILATNIRDITLAVVNQVDKEIYNTISENVTPTNINTAAATGTGWDDLTNGNPILDILAAQQTIRSYRYDPMGMIGYINSIEYKNLVNFLINVKGSSIPGFSSEKVRTGVVTELLNTKIVVSENATTDYALFFIPKRAATWKAFMPIKSAVIDDPGIGKKFRVWEEGVCLLTDPRAVHLTTDTVT